SASRPMNKNYTITLYKCVPVYNIFSTSFRKFPAVIGIVFSNSSIFTSPIVVWRRTVVIGPAIRAAYVKAPGGGRWHPDVVLRAEVLCSRVIIARKHEDRHPRRGGLQAPRHLED